MTKPIPFTAEQPDAVRIPDAMAIVAAERLRQHEKILRLRALREAAGASHPPGERKKTAEPVSPSIPA